MDFCCGWPLPCGGRAKVISARLNLSHGTRDVGGVCNFLGSVLPQQKFELTGEPVLQLGVKAWFVLQECVISSVLSCHSKTLKQLINQCYCSVLQLSFIWQAKENTSSRHEDRPTQKKSGAQFWLLFSFVFFLLPLSLPYVNWASQEGYLFHLRFSLRSLDLPLLYFHRIFPFFVF